MKLGQTILDIRKERKMTQEEFAQIFHVTRQTVSNWEKEKNYPDLETLILQTQRLHHLQQILHLYLYIGTFYLIIL